MRDRPEGTTTHQGLLSGEQHLLFAVLHHQEVPIISRIARAEAYLLVE